MIVGTIVSTVLVYIIHFFKLTLDYSGVEHAQFEDDVYYYYVKAVPKVTVTAPQVNVKHFNVKRSGRKELSDSDVQEVEEDYDYEDEDEARELFSDLEQLCNMAIECNQKIFAIGD